MYGYFLQWRVGFYRSDVVRAVLVMCVSVRLSLSEASVIEKTERIQFLLVQRLPSTYALCYKEIRLSKKIETRNA